MKKFRQNIFSAIVFLFISLLGFGLITNFKPDFLSSYVLLVDGKPYKKDDRLVFHEDGEEHKLKIIHRRTQEVYDKPVNYAFQKNEIVEIVKNNDNFTAVTLKRVYVTRLDFKLEIIDTEGNFKFTVTISTLARFVTNLDFEDITIYD